MNTLLLETTQTEQLHCCSKCGERKSRSEFYSDSANKSGLRSNCKVCHRLHNNTLEKRLKNGIRNKANRKKDPKQFMLYSAKAMAKKAGLPFALTISDLTVPEFCPVLGLKLEVATGLVKDNSPSLDKFIPELGYVPGNITVMSWRANALKKDATTADIAAIVDYVRRFTKEEKSIRPEAEIQQDIKDRSLTTKQGVTQ
jgi:hypothetical protein